MRRKRLDFQGPNFSREIDPLVEEILHPVTAFSSGFDFFDPIDALRRAVRAVDDRRRFDPNIVRPAYSLGRDARRLVAKTFPVGKRDDRLSARVGFAVPERVAVCVRRQQRREVIHATRKNGSGGSRRRRRNYWTDIDCK